jgi:hypothetical protein
MAAEALLGLGANCGACYSLAARSAATLTELVMRLNLFEFPRLTAVWPSETEVSNMKHRAIIGLWLSPSLLPPPRSVLSHTRPLLDYQAPGASGF